MMYGGPINMGAQTMDKEIEVNFEDTSGNSYRFMRPNGWAMWSNIPRVGEFVYDVNEFKFEILEVAWWEPTRVNIKVRRVR
jgi:hypothetical protein